MSLLGRMRKGGAGTLYRDGMAAFNAGRHAEALEFFERCAAELHDESDPVCGLALFYAAEAALLLGIESLPQDPALALERFETACRHNPHFPDLHCFVAAAELLLEHWDVARASLERVLQLDADHLEAHCLLAIVLHELGDSTGSRRELTWVAAHATQRRRPLPAFFRTLLAREAARVPGLDGVARRLGGVSEADASAALHEEHGARH